jgi:hypothetical protein
VAAYTLEHLHQVKGIQDSVVVIRVCQNELILKLWEEKFRERCWALSSIVVPNECPGEDRNTMPRGMSISESRVDIIES